MQLETVVDTTGEGIGIQASVLPNIREMLHAAGIQAVQEVFTESILPEAKALCPVGTDRDPHPGKNRDSIQVSFRDNPDTGWISAWIFTESGYGWLIEHGTSHNRALTKKAIGRRHGKVPLDDRTPAQPYIYPAMIQFLERIAERQREILEGL